jgi:eukaryotic-like serine/threonine-protein kinase
MRAIADIRPDRRGACATPCEPNPIDAMLSLESLSNRWPEIDALLDEALALPIEARTAWLESLPGERAELRGALRHLLAAHVRAQADDFMGTLPKFDQLESGGGIAEPKPGELIGAYRLVSALGHGGMGMVWLAERADGRLKRQVALKLPRLAWGSALADRLARERDILATLAHPHIARLYDAGVDQRGRPYLAMEYVEGQFIDVYCRDRQLPPRARLALLLQVCDAVAHAHARLVVHRDLKPANILVTGDGQVRLLDFGIAKLMEGELTAQTALTQISGRALTLDYASPEQIRGEPLGTASDVYSLAVVAYELLAGARPYRLKRGSVAELEEAIASADPPRASDAAVEPALRKSLRGDLDAILSKALKKEPSQRYPTMVAFAEDIQRHLNQQPVLAQPDSFAYRAHKFVLRHRLETAIAAVLVVSLVGGAYAQVAVTVALAAGASVALWQARAARLQARLAREQAARAEETKKFVLSFFEAADANRGGSRQTTAVDLLKQARERLEAASITDAATRAELLTTIGSGLFGLGEAQLAAPILEQAVKDARATLGDADRVTAGALLAYGFVVEARENIDLAVPYFDAAQSTMRRLGDMAGLASALIGLSSARANAAEFDSAIDLAWQAVGAAERQSPPVDNRVTIQAYTHVAKMISGAPRVGAIEPARKAVLLGRQLYGARPTSPMLEARKWYAIALGNDGDLDGALGELKALRQQRSELFGPEHPELVAILMHLTLFSLQHGDPAAAADHAREAVRICQVQAPGKPTYDLALMRLHLGSALANARRFEQALREWHEADAAFTAFSDAGHVGARLARSGVALALVRLGRLDEADAVFAGLQERTGNPTQEAIIKVRLGQLRSAQGRHAEACALLRDAPESFAHEPPAGRRRQRALSLAALGAALLAAGHHAQAVEALAEARTLLRKPLRHGSPDLADVSVDLARAHLALGKVREAIEASEEAAAFWSGFDATSRSAGLALLWHARASLAAGETAKAADGLRRAAAILEPTGLSSERALLIDTQRDIDASLPTVHRG